VISNTPGTNSAAGAAAQGQAARQRRRQHQLESKPASDTRRQKNRRGAQPGDSANAPILWVKSARSRWRRRLKRRSAGRVGIAKGERVVVDGQYKLQDNSTVRITRGRGKENRER